MKASWILGDFSPLVLQNLDTYCGGYFTHFFDITKEIHTYMNEHDSGIQAAKIYTITFCFWNLF